TEGRVGECEGRSAGHATRHVGDAVVQDAVHEVGGVLVGRGVDGLNAAALVYSNVDDDGARLHQLEVRPGDQVRRLGPRYQNRPDHQIGAPDGFEQVVAGG